MKGQGKVNHSGICHCIKYGTVSIWVDELRVALAAIDSCVKKEDIENYNHYCSGGSMLTAIGDVMRRCYERGWITTRDGNISMKKREGKYLYITPSGWRKTIVHPEHVVRLEIVTDPETGLRIPKVTEQQKPSGELWMHWNLQRDSKRTRTVVHVHATHVVAAVYAGVDLQAICAEFPEISRYTRVGPTVPPLPALSRELADVTAECFGLRNDGTIAFDIVGQANHGVCAVAMDPWAAYEHIERLDHICEIVLKSGVRAQKAGS